MAVTRRRFIGWGGAVVAVVVAKPAMSVLGVPSFFAHGAPSIPAHNEFAAHLGSSFRVKLDSLSSVRVALVDATVRPPHPKDARGLSGEAFSLMFKGPRSRPFAQGTYVVTHAALGTFPALIVPVDSAKKNRMYQVVVDRRTLAPSRSANG